NRPGIGAVRATSRGAGPAVLDGQPRWREAAGPPGLANGGAQTGMRRTLSLPLRRAVSTTVSVTPSPLAEVVRTWMFLKAGPWNGDLKTVLTAPVSAKRTTTKRVFFFPTCWSVATRARGAGGGGGSGGRTNPTPSARENSDVFPAASVAVAEN